MKKIRKTFKAIAAIIKNPWLLNNVLADDAVWLQYLEKNYQLKSGLPVVDINQLSPNFAETLNCIAFLDGSSLPTDFALLKSLSKRFKDCSYFEIGTWRGESVMNVAENCKECYTLNLSKEEILSLGLNEKYADLHGFFSKGKENIHHLTGNSLTYDFKSLNKKFDVVFIDGDHRYEYVKSDTENVFKHLLHDQSIVVWHDYAYNPEKLRPEVLAGILDGIPAAFRKYLYHTSNTMCAIFIRQNFSLSVLESPIKPDKIFKVKIESQSI
jgi:predicted O-methyltransferase YrrM